MTIMTLESEVIAALKRARAAAPQIALATTAEKNLVLKNLADAIRASAIRGRSLWTFRADVQSDGRLRVPRRERGGASMLWNPSYASWPGRLGGCRWHEAQDILRVAAENLADGSRGRDRAAGEVGRVAVEEFGDLPEAVV